MKKVIDLRKSEKQISHNLVRSNSLAPSQMSKKNQQQFNILRPETGFDNKQTKMSFNQVNPFS